MKKRVGVKVYSTQTCVWCEKAKEFFISNGVKFTDIDVGSNRKAAEEMIKKSHQMGIPVIDIGGKIIVGYDEKAFKTALKMI